MAGYTVVFDGTSMQTANIASSKIQYRGIPTKTLGSEVIAHANKSAVAFVDYPGRTIIISGNIKGSSAADLDARIDALKLATSGTDKNLDIGNGTATRRFIATVVALDFSNDDGQFTTAQFEMQVTTTNPFGLDTFTTTPINDTSQSSVTYAPTATFNGTAPVQKPVITYTLLDSSTGGSNLVTNPGFETDTSGWVQAYGTMSRVTAQHNTGVAALQVVNSGTISGSQYGDVYYNLTGLVIGQTYTLSAYMKGNAGGETITMSYFANKSTAVTLTNGWQRFTLTFVANGTSALIDFSATAPASGTWFLDDVSVQLVSTASIQIGNNATGQQLIITRKFSVNDVIVIDTVAKSITVNGVEIAPVGGFPEFKPGVLSTFGYTDTFTTRLFNFLVTYVAAYL